MNHSVRLDQLVKVYDQWLTRIPCTYNKFVLTMNENQTGVSDIANDPHCISLIHYYRSLMPMAQEARKPMFFLKPADGALGSHMKAVQDVYRDFRVLTKKILCKAGIIQI